MCVGLVPLAGCSNLGQLAVRNLSYETHLYYGDKRVRHDLRADARAALVECGGRHPRKVFTAEFRDGFVDGYSDYLQNGGPAVPPAVPPDRYRKAEYLSPEGHARVRDYMLGFKYGADVAVATGRRPFFTVPVLVSDAPPPQPPNVVVLPAPPDGLSTDPPAGPKPAPAPPAASEPLPKPRPLAPMMPPDPGSK
jgi:hypothetical protein